MGKAEKIKRMRKIKQRKEQRKRKRIIMNALLLIIAAAVIFSAVSCHRKRQEEKEAERNAAPVTTPITATLTPTKKPVKKTGDYRDFFINSAFVGNSFIDGMEIYELLEDADYFAKVGLSVNDAMTDSTVNGTKPVIDELDNGKSYDRIFMMFGENEVGWAHSDSFAEQYAKLIKKAKHYQTDAKIYLMSITPVSKEVSDKAIDDTTNEKIASYNKLIKQLAKDEDVIYCDIYKAVVNPDGVLPEEAASDGIHFTKEYYEKCLKYISANYSDDEPEQSGSPKVSASPETEEEATEDVPSNTSKAAKRL